MKGKRNGLTFTECSVKICWILLLSSPYWKWSYHNATQSECTHRLGRATGLYNTAPWVTGGPSSRCEMIISRNISHGGIIRVCRGIFTTALRNKKNTSNSQKNTSPYFHSVSLVIWPLTWRETDWTQAQAAQVPAVRWSSCAITVMAEL